MKTGTELSVAGMCSLAGFSRAGYYRAQQPAPKPSQEDLKLRDAMHRVALEWPSYGSRRMSRELRKRGMKVNRKRLQRLMREDNLLCVAKQKFVVTTDSAHPLPVYPNLPPTMNVTGINQLWIADITYIRLEEEFVYLAVILDAFSRRVIGWALGRTLEDTLTLRALRMALEQRRPAPGLVHHSDRGVQYASGNYTDLLRAQGIVISMSRKGNPYDNAKAESFMKTLKYEEVYREDYRDLLEAHAGIGRFLEQVYNQKRLHSALGHRPPAEFEFSLRADPAAAAKSLVTVSANQESV
jgi:putative transposase